MSSALRATPGEKSSLPSRAHKAAFLYNSPAFFVSFDEMLDLHTHSILSDGELLPFELARRAEARGYKALAITDHVDASNLDFVVSRTLQAVRRLRGHVSLEVIAGVELTHVPPALIAGMAEEARELGAELVVVHGETLAEPVLAGTNRAAILAGADILSHPGLIGPEEAALAAEKGVALEITARKGHCISNGHVARVALEEGAQLVINTDAHGPEDLITTERARMLLLGAGIKAALVEQVFETSRELVRKSLRRKHG
jgi:putative hydrolase